MSDAAANLILPHA